MIFTAQLTGQVNGSEIELSGGGSLEQLRGTVHGTYGLVTMPEGLDPLILSSCLITGYPNACSASDREPNPFYDQEYSYDRTIVFPDGEALELEARVWYDRSAMRSAFTLRGSAPTGHLGPVQPICESWRADASGEILGTFMISWAPANASLIVAEAKTRYTIRGQAHLESDEVFRRMKLTCRADRQGLELVQTSRLVLV